MRIFVKEAGGVYQELSLLGKSNKVFEINTGENSIFRNNVTDLKSTARPIMGYTKQINLDTIDKDNDTDIQPDKVCKT